MEKLIYAVNAILLFIIARYEYNSDSDKTIIITSLAFLGLLILNVILGFFTQPNKNSIYKHFYYSAAGLLIGALLVVYLLVP